MQKGRPPLCSGCPNWKFNEIVTVDWWTLIILIRVAVCGERIEANDVSKKDRDTLEVLAQVLIVKIWTTAFLYIDTVFRIWCFYTSFPFLDLILLTTAGGTKSWKAISVRDFSLSSSITFILVWKVSNRDICVTLSTTSFAKTWVKVAGFNSRNALGLNFDETYLINDKVDCNDVRLPWWQ